MFLHTLSLIRLVEIQCNNEFRKMIKKIILVFLCLFFISACCKDSIERNIHIYNLNNKKNIYAVMLTGTQCLSGHSFKTGKFLTQNILEFNNRKGKLTPDEFRIKMVDINSYIPQHLLRGTITINEDNIRINLEIEQSKGQFVSYFFNGKYFITTPR